MSDNPENTPTDPLDFIVTQELQGLRVKKVIVSLPLLGAWLRGGGMLLSPDALRVDTNLPADTEVVLVGMSTTHALCFDVVIRSSEFEEIHPCGEIPVFEVKNRVVYREDSDV